MITAFTGGIINPIQDKGNGKTASMVFNLLMAKYPHVKIKYDGEDFEIASFGEKRNIHIITNFHCELADEVISLKEMFERFFSEEGEQLQNTILAIDEMQMFVDSHFGMKKKSVAEMLMRLAQQSRKRRVEILYTTQRFGNVHKVIRAHTNYIYEPLKVHFDKYTLQPENVCIIDSCMKPHLVMLFNIMTDLPPIIFPLTPITQLYDSNEIILE